MNKYIGKKMRGVLSLGVLLTIFALSVPYAYAASFNNDPQDFDTLRVNNYTDNPTSDSSMWSTSASADAGDTVNIAIYYHNTSDETANNVRVRLTPQTTGDGNSHNFTAYVWADNATQVSGNVSVSLSSSRSISYKSGSVVWRPNQMVWGSQALPYGQDGSEIFSSSGLRLGDIASGWSTQGNVVVAFAVSGGSSGSQLLEVTTYSAESVLQNSAVLRGYVNPNGTSDTSRWFEWGTSSYSLNNSTTKIGQGSSAGSFNDSISGLSSNTTYYYRAVARNSAGTVYGGVQSFMSGSGTSQQRPFVSTNNATGISANGATLNCYVNPYGASNTTRWFEWGTNQNLGNRTNTLNHGSTATNASDSIYGLTGNTTYYFRCVAQNSYGTSYGSILSFYTSAGGGNMPEAITNSATNIDNDSARINGLGLSLNSISSDGWFEWGTNQNLGNTSTRIALGNVESNTFYQSLFGLTPNTTYYFRAVVQNTNGIDRGSIRSFRTNSYIPVVPPGPTPTLVRDAEITKTVENLDTPNGSRTDMFARRGESVRFTIKVENTGTYTLENVEVKDRVPYYLEFANADEENVNVPQREVVWFVGDMRPGAKESMILDMVVTEDARIGGIIENVAQIESERITRTSNNVTIRVSDNIGAAESATAGVIFGGSFLPTTLLGWLLLTILPLIVFLLVKMSYRSLEKGEMDAR